MLDFQHMSFSVDYTCMHVLVCYAIYVNADANAIAYRGWHIRVDAICIRNDPCHYALTVLPHKVFSSIISCTAIQILYWSDCMHAFRDLIHNLSDGCIHGESKFFFL